MTNIITPGQGLLFMKVGTHAQEPLEQIIARKTREIEEAGFSFWGYGGGTCHPQTIVQPFAKSYAEHGGVIYLCMLPMKSTHFAQPIRAEEFSVDGMAWEKIPPAVNVLGSRYALAIKNLHKEEFDLELSKTKVALGNSMGRIGSKYVTGRVDKACLEVVGDGPGSAEDERVVRIELIAELVEPYAVYLRNLA